MTQTPDYTNYVQVSDPSVSTNLTYIAGPFTGSPNDVFNSGGNIQSGNSVSWHLNGSTFTVTYTGYIITGGGPIVNLSGTFYALTNSTSTTGLTATSTPTLLCYLRGTRILTVYGEVPIEELQPGDIVVTRFGPLRPIKWMGKQSFSGIFLGQSRAPVRIRAGALGDNVPCRDLIVSPGHSLVVNDHLVCANLLVNGVTITQDATDDVVEYFHLDLGTHDCIIAEGAWSESYAEQHNRNQFYNASEFHAAFPEHEGTFQPMCLPHVNHLAHEALPMLRGAVLAHVPEKYFTDDAGVHLMVDGRRIDPEPPGEGMSWSFRLPAGVTTARLVSYACRPAVSIGSLDERVLGLRVTSLMVRTGTAGFAVLPCGSPMLRDGWDVVETDGQAQWRWTNGDALLPIGTLLALVGSHVGEEIELIVNGDCLPRYLRTVEVASEVEPVSLAA